MTVTVIDSPCVGVCRLDADTQICMGCYRTLDEIAVWSECSHKQKIDVLARLPARGSEHRERFAKALRATDPAVPAAVDMCVKCGAEFHCGMQSDVPCWCASFPPVAPSELLPVGCLCPDCLAAAVRDG